MSGCVHQLYRNYTLHSEKFCDQVEQVVAAEEGEKGNDDVQQGLIADECVSF